MLAKLLKSSILCLSPHPRLLLIQLDYVPTGLLSFYSCRVSRNNVEESTCMANCLAFCKDGEENMK